MPCSIMVMGISLLLAIICHTLLCMQVCVLESKRESKRWGETEKRKKAGKWGSLNKSGNGATEL